MPTGRHPVEPRGVHHYRQVLKILREGGIEPVVTLFHFDLPSALEADGGWLNASTAVAFREYARVCFEAFGDVKQWITVNEPHTVATAGYGSYAGAAAPGRCTNRTLCAFGNSSTEPYIAAHQMLLAHGFASQVYREDFQPTQRGRISIALSGDWTEPLNSTSMADRGAAQRRQEFQIGWFADPIWGSGYPESMVQLVGERLPRFTEEQLRILHGSCDYFALNHYTSRYAFTPKGGCQKSGQGWIEDQCCAETTTGLDGRPIGPQGGSDWLVSVPWGMRRLLVWLRDRYIKPEIVVTENGADDPPGTGLKDVFRIDYHRDYLDQMRLAMKEDGVNVTGYFVWSLIDNFEWGDGYHSKFGLWSLDVASPSLTRAPKTSVAWFNATIRNFWD